MPLPAASLDIGISPESIKNERDNGELIEQFNVHFTELSHEENWKIVIDEIMKLKKDLN